jgi:hypothetical protein
MARVDLSPVFSKIFVSPTIGLPHLRGTTVVEDHHNGVRPVSPIDTALSATPRSAAPATTNTPSAAKPRSTSSCIDTRQRSLGRIPATESSTTTKGESATSNTAARQIPAAITQRTQTKPKPREPNLWRASVRRGQEAHGDEEIPQHDESRGHLLVLVSAQQSHPSLYNNGTSHLHHPTLYH